MSGDDVVVPFDKGKRRGVGKRGRELLEAGALAPFGSREDEPDELPEWYASLAVDKKGKPLPILSNAVIAMQRSSELRGLRFNELRGESILLDPPHVDDFDIPKPGPVDDYAICYLCHWLSVKWGIHIGASAGISAMEIASKAKGRAFHPIRDYLRGLEWDGVERISGWLANYAGATDDEYTRTVGRMWLIAAVARAMQKMSVVKNMIILEGPQDLGKSTLLRKLCPDEAWFADTPIDLAGSGADKYQVLRGKWIFEISELDGFRNKEATRVKSFVSSPVDNFRKSYGRGNQDVPRQCVFAGTTNESQYLSDPTGNVRFWPVHLTRVDFDAVERDRDQLWAEAMRAYLDGEKWYIASKAGAELARVEQEAREEEDVWLDPIRKWVETLPASRKFTIGVSSAEALREAVSVDVKDQHNGHAARVVKQFKKLGLAPKKGLHRPRVFVLPAPEQVAPVIEESELTRGLFDL